MDVPHLSLAENQYQHPSTFPKKKWPWQASFFRPPFLLTRVETCRSLSFCVFLFGKMRLELVRDHLFNIVGVEATRGGFWLLIKGVRPDPRSGCNLGSLDKPGQRTTSLQMIGDRILFVGILWGLGDFIW